MKHTKKRLLAVLLVLAMAIGMVPFAALSVGAESALVDTITVNEDRVIQDLDWTTAYVATPYNDDGKTAGQVVKKWNGPYRLSEIVIVPKAGTTLRWVDPVSAGTLDEGQYFLTSWKSVGENEWEIDLAGANLVAAGRTTNDNQIYNEADQTVTYMYTTTSDNEALRFASYGTKADGNLTESMDECPAVLALDTTFAEGKVEGVTWLNGAVVSQGFGGKIDRTVEKYKYSNPIMIPKAGTTVSLNGVCDEGVFAISVWRANDNGTLEMIYGCAGSEENNAWTTVTPAEEAGAAPTYTYAYTSAYDNEFIRISGFIEDSNAPAPVISYKENNAEALAPVLKAAGYDPAQGGTPYMLKWYDGVISVSAEGLVFGGEDYSYAFSDILPVYKAGTKVTFTDVAAANATVADFATEGVYTVARFDGSKDDDIYAGLDATNFAKFLAGVAVGDNNDDRQIALNNGKRVYTYTTTDANEYLRFSYCRTGNKVNGYVINPIIYISAPGEGSYYNALEGLTVYSVGAKADYWGETDVNYTWYAALNARYGWNYMDVDTIAQVRDADVLIYHANGTETVADIQAMMDDDTLLVVVTDNAELATELKAMNDDSFSLVYVYEDLPYRHYPDFAEYDTVYATLYMDNMGLNAAGHALVAPWFEKTVAEGYLNFGDIVDQGGSVIKFVNGDNVVSLIGTAGGERTFKAPGTPDGVYAPNMFGWVGTMKTADGQETVRVFAAGEQITVPQNTYGEFAPLCIDMDQVDGATLNINTEKGTAGLRFLSAVNEADYKNVLKMIEDGKLGNATVTLGMLIVPYQYVLDLGGELTHAALKQAELPSVEVTSDVKAGESGELNWYNKDDTNGYVAGTLDEIKYTNYFKDFTARGYAKLTIDGVDYYAYAENDDVHGVVIYEKAYTALNDCYPRPKDGYLNQISENVYSPYTVAERTILAKYVKGVVELETVRDPATNMQTAQLASGEYYDANAMAMRKTFTVVGGGSDSLNDIFYEYPDPGKTSFAAAPDGWAEMLEALGADPLSVDSICVVKVRNGDEIGAIVLDGFILDINDPAALCAKYTYNGDTCYLIGFSNYTDFN